MKDGLDDGQAEALLGSVQGQGGDGRIAGWDEAAAVSLTEKSTVPFKANADRRHHIPKQRHRATNLAAYDAALRQRGSLTVWFTEEALAAWTAAPRATPGEQPRVSALAIATALTLWAVFRLALRQTEGLVGSIIALLGLDLAVPDHAMLSRRAETLQLPRPKLHRDCKAPSTC